MSIIKRTINVEVVKKTPTGVLNPTNPVTLKNTPTLGGGVTRLDSLIDVNASGEANGATLVYNSLNDTYVVEKMNLSNVVGDLDGGTF